MLSTGRILRSNAISRQQIFRCIDRKVHATPIVYHGDTSQFDNAPRVTLHFKDKDGSVTTVKAPVGMSILQVAHQNDVNLEGACESSLACSTCHVILTEPIFDSLPEACEEEEDMLDMAFGLTPTSRLGCQIFVAPEMENTTVTLPTATRNFYVDGHVPKPH